MAFFDNFRKLVASQKDQNPRFSAYDEVILASIQEHEKTGERYWSAKVNTLNSYKEFMQKFTDAQKIEFIHFLVTRIRQYIPQTAGESGSIKRHFQDQYLRELFHSKLVLGDQDVRDLYELFLKNKRHHIHDDILSWPIGSMVNQLAKQYKDNPISEELKNALQALKTHLESYTAYHREKEQLKIIERIDEILFKNQEITKVRPTRFLGTDDFARYANAKIEATNNAERDHWYLLIAHAQKASGAKPTQKYLTTAQTLLEQLGVSSFISMIEDWFSFLIKLKNRGVFYNLYVDGVTTDEIKGFVWMSSLIADKNTLNLITLLAERAYLPMPEMGPVAVAIGNACFFALYKSPGLYGVGQLSGLKFRIKSNGGRKLIEKYLEEAASEKQVPKHEIEDLAAPDYELQNGQKELQFGDFKAVLRITGIGKTEIQWCKPDGSPQKSIPASVKTQFAAELKELRNEAKEIEQGLITQKDRLDRMLRVNRQLKWGYFYSMLFSHGLLSYLYEQIIWRFEKDGLTQSGIYLNGQWTNEKGQTFVPAETCTVSLWHPVGESIATIQAWRHFLQTQQIQQPFKQAFREVYLLTDAEVNTRVYSNRMAAHLLKQHQFNSLAKSRGWKYALMGAYDDGRYNEAASLDLPEYGLRAEFWINEVNANDAYNDAGIWHYVATDQVRFVNTANDQPCNLIDVPTIIFSEVMRDVDLFVGVASVGNDPTWSDSGGIPAYRDYWQAYSFGDLSELAKTRKEILTQLLPRLKINKVAEIKERFLVVKGKLRTYKIHLGSTNILMEPNDQYLCIVPDRSKPTLAPNVFLPFEGDTGLSIILSKAFLLAEDDQIEDGTIVRQIGRR